jgi:hypothetical protein
MPRFRLRTFLIAITAFCLLLWRVSAVESVEGRIRDLEQIGWEIRYYAKFIDSVDPGTPLLVHTPRRTYWQKLFFGYRECDLPFWATFRSNTVSLAKSGQTFERSVSLLNKLPTISTTSVIGVQVTAEDLSAFTHLVHIRVLDLSNLPIGDEVAPQLGGLTQLDELYIHGTKLSEDAVVAIETHLPSCDVVSDYSHLKALDSAN